MDVVREEVLDVVPAIAQVVSKVFRGLLWRQWLAHGNTVLSFLALWLVCGWVLQIFFHPGWILGFGVLYAFWAGPALGGGDAAEGSEEFSFSLPPTRGERYLAGLALGGGTLLAFLVLGLLTIALDLPQILWGLFVNSGFTEPFPPCEPRFLYALAFFCPLAAFAFSFAIASAAESRGLISYVWLLSGLITGAVVGGGFLCEQWLWHELNGFVSCPALLALGALGLQAGYLAYVRKEGVSRPAPMGGKSRGWVWVVLVMLVLVMLMSAVVYKLSFQEEAMRNRFKTDEMIRMKKEALSHERSEEVDKDKEK